jgi:thiol-disulfide isomerase/thioredoxin
MFYKSHNLKINFLSLFLIIFFFNTLFAQSNQLVVPLKIEKTIEGQVQQHLFYKDDYSEFGLSPNEISREVFAPGNVLIKVLRHPDNETDFDVLVDSNMNGKLEDETSHKLSSGSNIIVEINRKQNNGKYRKLPYYISYNRDEKKGIMRDYFYWRADYKATGTFKTQSCSEKITLVDFQGDGVFDSADEQMTNLQIDFNKDGKIWGKEEHKRTNEIIKICEQNYLVGSIAKDGSSITFKKTNLSVAKVGEKTPPFEFTLLNGKIYSSENLSGRYVVLDFWATWCVPCVKNLPEINKLKNDYGEKVKIFSINVDSKSREKSALDVVQKYELYEMSSIRGLGNNDDFWKSFGSINQGSLAIPLYVFINDKGIVQYADNGGNNLQNLRNEIDKTFNP